MNSRDDNQLRGEDVPVSTLESNCGNKTYDGSLILNPCGSIANSLFNDIFHLKTEGYVLNEHDISWKYDREKYKNPSVYDESKSFVSSSIIIVSKISVESFIISWS